MASLPRVFISYCHADEPWKDRVVQHVRVLAPTTVWQDRQIAGGDDWRREIETAMASCDVALLLVSAAFLTSDFILGTEVPELLRRRESEGLRVIPVILKPCAWPGVAWLKSIQARPKDGKALSQMAEPEADQALADLSGEVHGFLKALAGALGQASTTHATPDRHLHASPLPLLEDAPNVMAPADSPTLLTPVPAPKVVAPTTPRRDLAVLLMSLFEDASLRTFLLDGPDGTAVSAALPGPSASWAEVADKAVEALRKRNRINTALFDRLTQEFGGQNDYIRRVQARWV